MLGLGRYGDEIFAVLNEGGFRLGDGSVFSEPLLVSLDIGRG